ncbi:MAG: DUF5671 domain-containing protein [Chloroflexia bacterium]
MHVVRRVYLYLISFISLMMVLSGASNLLRLLLEGAFGLSRQDFGFFGGDYWRNQFSLWGATLFVGAVVWAIHWFFAQRTVASSDPDADDERRSVLRKLFIYAVLAVCLWQVAFATSGILMALMWPFLSTGDAFASLISSSFPQLIIYGIGGMYYWSILRQDNQATPEGARAATIRCWYTYLVSYVALSVLMAQLTSLARFLWQFATDPAHPWSLNNYWIPPAIAAAVPWIIVAGAIWLFHWNAAQQQMVASEEEQRSTLRKVYLFALTLQTAVVTLGSLAILLNSLLRVFWGTDPVGNTGESILTAAGAPLASALVYGAFWVYHRLVIRWDASLIVSQVSSRIAILQLYRYMVALIGLAFLAVGVTDMLRLLIDQLLGGTDIVSMSPQAWGDHLSFVATTIIIGTITWLATWLPVQREALSPGAELARYSLPRRLYLVLVLFFTVTALLTSAAWLLYQLLRFVGEPVSSWIGNASLALATTITAGTLLAYHASILRADQRARPAPLAPILAPPPPPALPATILLLRADNPSALEASIATFQPQLPETVRADFFHAPGITPTDVAAWLSNQAAAATPDTPPAPQPDHPPTVEPFPA